MFFLGGVPTPSFLSPSRVAVTLSPTMSSNRTCAACARPFTPDLRTAWKQRFCSRPACQKARRLQAQRARRATAKGSGAAPGTTREVKPSEAQWLLRNPLFIGFVSHVIASRDRDHIEAVCRRWIASGQNVLDGLGVAAEAKHGQSAGKTRPVTPAAAKAPRRA